MTDDTHDDVFIEAIPLAQKVPVVDYQLHNFVKELCREDLETLWRIVKDRFSIKKPTNFSDEYLLLTLKTMFGELDEHDAIWRNQKSVHGLALVKRWKLLTSCGVHVIILSTVQLFLLVKRRYPLSRFTLKQLVNVARLQEDECVEKTYTDPDHAEYNIKVPPPPPVKKPQPQIQRNFVIHTRDSLPSQEDECVEETYKDLDHAEYNIKVPPPPPV
nr:hypothetical protein [Tanacetum cinerariifolium]